jgi:hypothetical protein
VEAIRACTEALVCCLTADAEGGSDLLPGRAVRVAGCDHFHSGEPLSFIREVRREHSRSEVSRLGLEPTDEVM